MRSRIRYQPAAQARTIAYALACAAGWFSQSHLFAQETTYALSLRAVGPPVPSFRYELVPPSRDLISNNAALLHYRAFLMLGENRPAAKDYYQAQEKFQTVLDGSLKDFPKDEARTFLRPFSSVFKEVEEAAKCDRCEWGTEQRFAAEGIGLLLPEAQKMRELAFLLKLRCRLHLANGKIELALRDIQTGLVLGRHAAQGPTVIHFLIGNAIATMFIAELEQALQTPDCPNLYWSLTALPRPLIDLRKGIDGETRAMAATIPFPKNIDKGPMTPEDALAALDRLWRGIQRIAEQPEPKDFAEARLGLALYVTLQHPSARKSLLAGGKTAAELEAMPAAQVVMLDALVRFRNLRDDYFVWVNAPYAEAMQGMHTSEEKIKAMQKEPFNYLQSMLLLLLPAMEKVYGAQIRTERQIASLRTVEAIRLYAAKNGGKLPATLAEVTLVPVPVDPVSGKPFEYSVQGNRYTVSAPAPTGAATARGNQWKFVVTIVK